MKEYPVVCDCDSCGAGCSYSDSPNEYGFCYGQVRIIEQNEDGEWHGCEGHKNMIWDGAYIPWTGGDVVYGSNIWPRRP